MKYKLLVVEDETAMLEILYDYFTAKGFQVDLAKNGLEALEQIHANSYDLVLLDVMMPGLDGFGVCRELRKSSEIPVVFMTALLQEQDKLMGYELGADDYITKPFSLPVLYAKVNALIRRAEGRSMIRDVFELDQMTVHSNTRTLERDGVTVQLPPKVYELLVCFIQNRGHTLSREQLLIKVWGYDFEGEDRVVDSHVKKLRKMLGPHAGIIKTVTKLGYRLEVS